MDDQFQTDQKLIADPENIYMTLDIDQNGYISTLEMSRSEYFLNSVGMNRDISKKIDVMVIFEELDLNNNGI